MWLLGTRMLLYLAVLITHFPLSCWISVNFPVVSEAFGVEFDVEYKYLGLSVSLDRQDIEVSKWWKMPEMTIKFVIDWYQYQFLAS